MKTVKILPNALKGNILIPPSKSMSHRAVIAASLSSGKCIIDNIDLSDDIIATCKAMESMGAEIDVSKSGRYQGRNQLNIKGTGGSEGIKFKTQMLDCGESGSTARFIIPITRLIPDRIAITGSGKLILRPFTPYYEIFDLQKISYNTVDGNLPLEMEGILSPGCFNLRGDVSSQFITGLLMTLPLLSGDSRINITTGVESIGYIELTLSILKTFGIAVKASSDYREYKIPGKQQYKAVDFDVEGDYSQAAFWAVAAAIEASSSDSASEIIIESLSPDSLQGDKKIIDLIKHMGGNIDVDGSSAIVKPANTVGMDIDVSQIPDLVPILAVLASVSKGTTRIYNAQRLRIKESDRLKAITTELNSIGANITEEEDSLMINGVEMLNGGRVYGWNDHRIVMAMASASVRCRNPLVIEGADAVSKSYPKFFNDFVKLGGIVE